MLDYYYYLWSTTWPYLVVLFLLLLLLLAKLYRQLRRTWRYERDAWGFIVLAAKAALIIGVILIYGYMLLWPHRDWGEQPASFAGIIETIETEDGKKYYIEVRNEDELQSFELELENGEWLEVGEYLELYYLPHTKKVYKGEVRPD